MGFSICWIGARSDRPSDVCRRIGVRRTGQTADFFDFPISGTLLPTAWYVVVFNGTDHPLQREDRMQRISEAFPTLRCLVEEHAMYSAAAAWTGGGRTWHVVHDPRNGRDHLSTTGDVPPELDAINRDIAMRRTAIGGMGPMLPVDHVFDAPLLLAKRITGFRHDEDLGQSSDWERLVPDR